MYRCMKEDQQIVSHHTADVQPLRTTQKSRLRFEKLDDNQFIVTIIYYLKTGFEKEKQNLRHHFLFMHFK